MRDFACGEYPEAPIIPQMAQRFSNTLQVGFRRICLRKWIHVNDVPANAFHSREQIIPHQFTVTAQA